MIKWSVVACIDYLRANYKLLTTNERFVIRGFEGMEDKVPSLFQRIAAEVSCRKKIKESSKPIIEDNNIAQILNSGPVKQTLADGSIKALYCNTTGETDMTNIKRKVANLKLYSQVENNIPKEINEPLNRLLKHYAACGCFSNDLRSELFDLHKKVIR